MLYLRSNRVIFPRFVALDTVFELAPRSETGRLQELSATRLLN